MKYKNNFLLLLFILLTILSCSLENNDQIVINKEAKKEVSKKVSKEIKNEQKRKIPKEEIKSGNLPKYFLGEPYYIEGFEYIPREDYNYDETGLASFYGKELHNIKTENNEYNKVTELYGRHKTLPLPSIVKITNLENGLSVIVRVNDRGPRNNARIIEVSRKVAQLLRFYKSQVAKVRVQILVDPSKQLKIVSQSINDPEFNETIESAPTEKVTITELNETIDTNKLSKNLNSTQPIELGFEEINEKDLYIIVSDFNSYEEIQTLKDLIKVSYKANVEKENQGYSIIFGPLLNNQADNLFHILVSKGYKQSKIIIK